MTQTLAFLFGGSWGPMEFIVLGLVALLIFGRRLPEVGKSLGKGIVEFKKGLSGIEDEIDQAGSAPAPPPEGDANESTSPPQIDQPNSVHTSANASEHDKEPVEADRREG